MTPRRTKRNQAPLRRPPSHPRIDPTMPRRRHLVTAALWLAVLAVSWALYRHEQSLQHFAWHLGYGSAAGLLAGAAWILWQGPIDGHRTLWPLAGYLYMAIPDVIWLVPTLWGAPPYPHEPWMDVFLGHYSLDRWSLATPMLAPAVLLGLGAFTWAQRHANQASATP